MCLMVTKIGAVYYPYSHKDTYKTRVLKHNVTNKVIYKLKVNVIDFSKRIMSDLLFPLQLLL